jgi:CheY-like chemotaxis protein
MRPIRPQETGFTRLLADHGTVARFHEFHSLMRFRIREILLVSSLYDSFILEEDGTLSEMMLSEYLDLNLSNAPAITCVPNATQALALSAEPNRFGLVITTMNLPDMNPVEFARQIKAVTPDMPVIILAYDNRELADLTAYYEISVFDNVFVWQGDFRILIAMVKVLEDRANVDHDTQAVGVQSIIVVEDNIHFCSSFLPLIYTELFKHTQRLMEEGVNLSHKRLRMRARPKILLCSTYEEAIAYFERYQSCILGLISDIEFPCQGRMDSEAGLRLAEEIKRSQFDIPILLQSDSMQHESIAHRIGAAFLFKRSPTLLQQVREFMVNNLCFGDFIFRMPDGRKVGRADSLKSLEEQLQVAPDESIRFHAERNHFSNWLKARTEFWLAHELRPRRVSDFASIDALRRALIESLSRFRRERHTGTVADFDAENFDPGSTFARIGAGSLGGKARGLGFVISLLRNFKLDDLFADTAVFVPPAVVLATDIFDQFMDTNNLRDFALNNASDEEIIHRFLSGRFSPKVLADLTAFLGLVNYPLAVRSSSLLEDSKYQPFAGVYQTYMLPNNDESLSMRLDHLLDAVKRVYASTFFSRTKQYIAGTPYRLEEEKMAVMIQQLVGTLHGQRFYPSFSGVARSYNYYPHPPMSPADGVVSVALGLGKPVVEGDLTLRFCPKFPHHVVQFSDPEDALKYSQREFWTLEFGENDSARRASELQLSHFPLEVAEADGTLGVLASTYSRENDSITDGISRPGARLVTFAPILKGEVFPLSEIINTIIEMGTWGLAAPVEIEFAVNLVVPPGRPREFAFLQMRPLATLRDGEELTVDGIEQSNLVCQSSQVLGNGLVDSLFDIIAVNPDDFRRDKCQEIAREISQYNAEMVALRKPYLLIGFGRWGSSDPWLGIPVSWDQISGAQVIIETGFKDFDCAPSQGSHFFQNIAMSRVGYFTVSPLEEIGFVDWQWLATQHQVSRKEYTRHLRCDNSLVVKMNGRLNRGVILKPGLHGRSKPQL